MAYVLILTIGLIMVYSMSSMIAESRFGSHWYFLRQQFLWAVLSALAIVVLLKVDLRRFAVYSVPAIGVTLVLLCAVFAMEARNGSHRWIIMGPFTFQPSELYKFLVVFYLAFSLANPLRDVTKLRNLLFPYVPLVSAGLVLILAEPDLGTTMVVALTVMGILYVAGARWKHLIVGLASVGGAATFVVMVLGYKKGRMLDYLAALGDPLRGSYQAKQAVLALGAGGVFGGGFGDGRQKVFFLPYPHTDFIFAAIGEEIGLAGLVVLSGLFFFLLWRGLHIAAAQPDRFGYLLATGMTLSLFVNVALNIAVVTSLLPVTGLPLPFISYGGSSLLMSSAAVGVLLNLSRRVVNG